MSATYNRKLHGLAQTMGMDHDDLKQWVQDAYEVPYESVDNQLAQQIVYDLNKVLRNGGIDWVPERMQKLRITLEEVMVAHQAIDAALARDYHLVAAYLRIAEKKFQTWKYLYRYKNGIRRVEEFFQDTWHRPAWPQNMSSRVRKQHKNKVGFYLSILGVARCIGDMMEAKKEGAKPRYLLYFTDARDHASRWELLTSAKIEEEWDELKALEMEASARIDISVGRETVPDWVQSARNRIAEITEGKNLVKKADAPEVRTLIFRLKNAGYDLNVTAEESTNDTN